MQKRNKKVYTNKSVIKASEGFVTFFKALLSEVEKIVFQGTVK